MKQEEIITILNKFLKSKVLFVFVVFVFVLKIFASLIFVNLPINIFFADITKSTLISMLNQTRQSLGLTTLTENTQLNQAAKLKAKDMVENGYFSHTSPTGTTPWYWFSQSGYNYKYAGENLAIGFYDSQEVYNAWLNSSSHKENMLNSAYTEVGTAILSGFGDNNAIIVVQLFGTPKTITKTNPMPVTVTKVTPTEKPETTKPEIIEESPATSDVAQNVLAASTTIESDKGNYRNDLYAKFLSFITYSYDTFLEYIIYALTGVMILMSAYIISFNFKNSINNGLVLRSLVLITVLTSSLLINKDLIVSLLPHQIII